MTSTTDCPRHHSGSFGPPRFGSGPVSTALNLGPLASLPGSWSGTGFNTIWRPDNTKPPENSAIKRFLELNLTKETLDFHVIPGVVPNRGVANQSDLDLYGLHYLQRVTDADKPPFSTAGQALHIEPGLFMNVPASSDPENPPSIVRMASIPHGVSLLMQGPTPSTVPVLGAPIIPPIYPIEGLPTFTPAPGALGLGIQPFDLAPPAGDGAVHVVPEIDITNDIAYPGSQSNGPYPPAFQGYINDPNSLLRSAIAGQDILGHITISLSTQGVGSGIENIPFLGTSNPANAPSPAAAAAVPANAFVSSATATFWIEWVRYQDGHHHGHHHESPEHEGGRHDPLRAIEPFWEEKTFLQLQYSQVVILVFNGVLWPHVTVATLQLGAG